MGSPYRQQLKRHLGYGISLFLLFAILDSWLTLKGIQGDPALEANPLIRYLMLATAPLTGLIIGKLAVLTMVVMVALLAAKGIEKDANWVYWLALTRLSRQWMKRKKRWFIAFLPLHLAAIAQLLAASSWLYLFSRYG